MSDRDAIIHFLERAERRTRSNRRFNEIAVVLAAAFPAPVVFKLLDFFLLFRGGTVVVFFVVWAAATAAGIVFRIRGRNSLAHIAAGIDSEARLNDQLKTAYWFIRNPRESEWVEAQIQKTARRADELRLDVLYPRRVPRASLTAAGLLFLLVVLNFIPLNLNYNWVYLQAAPPFRLLEAERRNLDSARSLLEQAKAAENAVLAQKIQEIIDNLEQGEISAQEAVQQLEALKQELEQAELDAANTTIGIEQMAAILRQAEALREAAQPMARGDLGSAAQEMRELAADLGSLPSGERREMTERLFQASERPRTGLENLARAFEETAAALEKGDNAAERAGLESVASELETLKDQLRDQQLRNAAGDELAELTESLEERLEGEFDEGETAPPGATPSNSGQRGVTPGERGQQTEKGEGDPQGEGEPADYSEDGEPGEPGEEGAGQNPGDSSLDAPNGRGGNSFGGSTQSAPLEGEATSLEVQLQQEALKLLAAEGGIEPEPESEAAGERERSKLDYRNAPSDLSPAQKDLLNQDRIPWESRQLIKNYFQAVKPAKTP